MGVPCNYIRWIHSSISAIHTQTNWVWCNDWIKIRWNVMMRMLWHSWMRAWWHSWIRITNIIFMLILSLHTPWNIFLMKPWVENVKYTMFIWRKIGTPVPPRWYITWFQYTVMQILYYYYFNALNSEMDNMKANTRNSQISVVGVSSIDGSEYLRLLWSPAAWQ